MMIWNRGALDRILASWGCQYAIWEEKLLYLHLYKIYETFKITKKIWKTNEEIMQLIDLANTSKSGSVDSSEWR